MLTSVLLLVASYLLGAVPFGYLVARGRGVDILRQGSGNIGATNVGRVLGRRWGLVVFVLDFAKGAVPVAAANLFAQQGPARPISVGAGVAAFLGHLFPVYLRFRGGKGVATAAGVVAVLVPVPFLAAILAWLSVFASSRYVSLASLVAAAVLCLVRLLLTLHPWSESEVIITGFCLAAAALILFRHHANVRRLLAGTENRFGETPTMTQLVKVLHVLAVGLWFGTLVFFTLVGAVLFAKLDARTAGAAVGPLFPWFFGLQTGCALVALVTALAWVNRPCRAHRIRVWALLVALATVGVGWWLDSRVHALLQDRDHARDAAALSNDPALVQKAAEAQAAFSTWHTYSLTDNFITLIAVALAMVLAANLPGAAASPKPEEKKLEPVEAHS